ncbi:TAF6L factor, partial [Pitta sordida]|nr:TAF6L factor [Pitta sordida]
QAVCGFGSQDSLPFRPIKEGDLFFQEDREVNLVELALNTNIPKGCAETAVRGISMVSLELGDLGWSWVILGVPDGISWGSLTVISVVSGVSTGLGGPGGSWGSLTGVSSPPPPKCQVKSVSHDLEQLNRLLHLARSLVLNPFLGLGSYVCSLIGSVLYCVLEPLAASINPLNDHWTLRDCAALLLSRIFWWGGGL